MCVATLAERFPLIEMTVTAAGRDWKITAVTDQNTLVDRIKTEVDLENFPYGLMLWASALGLADRLREERASVAGKSVLEIGAGIGLAGLVAASLGAERVVQTDFLEDALTLCRYNAATNDITNTEVRLADWRAWPVGLGPFPLVIGSDILYERSLHDLLMTLFPRLVMPGGTILLSDPLRPQALDFIERLEKSGQWIVGMESIQVLFDGKRKDLALFRLRWRDPVGSLPKS